MAPMPKARDTASFCRQVRGESDWQDVRDGEIDLLDHEEAGP